MILVRFNLGKGPRYMTWKVENKGEKPQYYQPSEVQLTMINCKLVNKQAIARKIFNGEIRKTVCAWVQCDEIVISSAKGGTINLDAKQLRYNPKVATNWVYQNKNVDGEFYKEIKSLGKQLYITP